MPANPNESRIFYAKRILGMAENLLLRQMPSDVNPETARRCVDAAADLYVRFDETVVAAADELGAAAPREVAPDTVGAGGEA